MNIVPSVFEKHNNSDFFCDIYSKLLKDRIIFLTGEITDITANIIVSQLIYLDSLNNEDIYLYINSPGGSVTSGFSIYDTMNFIKSDVQTIGIGLCASMAAFILSSGTIGKRLMLPNAEVMIHQPLGGAQGQESDIQIAAKRIKLLKKKLNKILSINTKQNIKKIELDCDRDNYMDANQALKYGIIDKIIN